MEVLNRFADILDYPDPTLSERLDELDDNHSLSAGARELIERFRNACGIGTGCLKEIYTGTFELKAGCSLYAGYHLFGDHWRRSAFLAHLQHSYRANGFSAGMELPDHLCVILRFIACQGDTAETRDLVDCCLVPSVSKILGQMDRAANPYAAVLEALLLWLYQMREKAE